MVACVAGGSFPSLVTFPPSTILPVEQCTDWECTAHFLSSSCNETAYYLCIFKCIMQYITSLHETHKSTVYIYTHTSLTSPEGRFFWFMKYALKRNRINSILKTSEKNVHLEHCVNSKSSVLCFQSSVRQAPSSLRIKGNVFAFMQKCLFLLLLCVLIELIATEPGPQLSQFSNVQSAKLSGDFMFCPLYMRG